MKKPVFRAQTLVLLAISALLFPAGRPAFAQDKAAKIDALMKLYHDYGQFNGSVLVAEAGEVIYKKGFGLANLEWDIPNAPDTRFRLGSITKQFTSMLILQLVEAGKVALDGKLADYLPTYRRDTGRKVTIHHLLTHSSGIPSYTNLPNFGREAGRNPYGVEEFVKTFCSADLEFEPGSQYKYNNSGYFLLGAVIEAVTGHRYEAVLEERIFRPLGMKDTGYDHYESIIKNRAAGYEQSLDGFRNAAYLDMSGPFAAGALYSTVEDLSLWDRALYTDKLLSPTMRALLFKPQIKAGAADYGYGWGVGKKLLPVSKREVSSVSHAGGINGFASIIERLVDDRHLVVLLTNAGGANLRGLSAAIIRILYGEPYDLPKKSIARTLYGIIRENGLEAGIARYRELRKSAAKDYEFNPAALNELGYGLLEQGRVDDAVKIFQLNVEEYPQNANAYDSLAEAYVSKGETALAILNYAKSLELDPANANAAEQLAKLKKKNGGGIPGSS